MILPTPDFDPLFAHDGQPFEQKMWNYIRREFADLLPQVPELPMIGPAGALSETRDPQESPPDQIAA